MCSNAICAESTIDCGCFNLAEKSALHLGRVVEDQSRGEGGQLVFRRGACALERRCRGGRVVRLNSCELFEYGAGGVCETGAALPHLKALRQHESEKADEDTSLHAFGAPVLDRAQVRAPPCAGGDDRGRGKGDLC